MSRCAVCAAESGTQDDDRDSLWRSRTYRMHRISRSAPSTDGDRWRRRSGSVNFIGVETPLRTISTLSARYAARRASHRRHASPAYKALLVAATLLPQCRRKGRDRSERFRRPLLRRSAPFGIAARVGGTNMRSSPPRPLRAQAPPNPRTRQRSSMRTGRLTRSILKQKTYIDDLRRDGGRDGAGRAVVKQGRQKAKAEQAKDQRRGT